MATEERDLPQRDACCIAEHPADPAKLCHSCADYRGYRKDIREAQPVYQTPAGFQHTPYKATTAGIKAAQAAAQAEAAKEAKKHGR